MIAIFDNNQLDEEHSMLFLDIGQFPVTGAQAALRLVQPCGEIVGLAETVVWTNGGVTESFLNEVERGLGWVLTEEEVQAAEVRDFKVRLSSVPSAVLVAIADHMKAKGRPNNEKDYLAKEIIDEAAWRTRPSRRRRA